MKCTRVCLATCAEPDVPGPVILGTSVCGQGCVCSHVDVHLGPQWTWGPDIMELPSGLVRVTAGVTGTIQTPEKTSIC